MKTPGELSPPPPEQEFNRLPLRMLPGVVSGVFYRLHPRNAATGLPWPAVYFSQRGSSRFDPVHIPSIHKRLASLDPR